MSFNIGVIVFIMLGGNFNCFIRILFYYFLLFSALSLLFTFTYIYIHAQPIVVYIMYMHYIRVYI